MDIRFSQVTIWTALTAPVAAAAIFAGGYWAGMASAAPEQAGASTMRTFPDWFLPIWDAYDATRRSRRSSTSRRSTRAT